MRGPVDSPSAFLDGLTRQNITISGVGQRGASRERAAENRVNGPQTPSVIGSTRDCARLCIASIRAVQARSCCS